MPTLGSPINIGSGGTTGLDAPPPYGTVPGAVVVGASPVRAYDGHAGELAEEVGDGTYKFTSKLAMKDRTYLVGGTLYTYSGSAFLSQATTYSSDLSAQTSIQTAIPAQQTASPVSSHEVALLTDEAATLVGIAPPAAVDGNYKLRATWSGTGTVLAYAWVAE